MTFKRLLPLVCLVVLAACGRGENKEAMENTADSNEQDASFRMGVDTDARVHVVTDKGEFNAGNAIPANWPQDVAIYPDATVEYSASATMPDGQDGVALSLSTKDSAEQAIDFYKQTLSEQGWTVQSTLESGEVTIIAAEKDDRVFAASITRQDDQTMIALGVGRK